MGLSSAGSGISEAYNDGATDKEATVYGISKGVIDAGTELLFGGLGKTVKAVGLSKGLSSLDDIFAKKLSSKISNQVAKNFVEYSVKSGAEGFEEVLAALGTAIAKKLTYMDEEELSELVKDENLLEQFVVGMATSGMVQSGYIPAMQNGSLKEANATGRDFITGYTQNEEIVIEKEVENRIKEKEADGKKLTNKEKSKIRENVMQSLDKGYISIDTIESALGGETYQQYQKQTEYKESLEKELAELDDIKKSEMTGAQEKRKAEIEKILKNFEESDNINNLKERLSSEVSELAKNSRLAESYNEQTRKGQAFEADLLKYDAKQAEVVKRAVESGILNNTNKTHDFVDMVSKISAEKGVFFDFTNNKKLKESGFAIDGKQVNGFVKDGNVTLNIDSAKSLESVVGHEIVHVLKGTEIMPELQSIAKEIATIKGEYQTRYDALKSLYEGIEDANIEEELTADLIGDYLFTDSDFVKRLSAEKPNVFKKIYNEIKYLCKVATTGSKELRELEKLKKTFEKAYQENSVKVDGNVQFSLVGTENGIEVYETSESTKELSYKERKQQLLNMMVNEYAGRTAKFTKNGEVYYAFYDKDGLNKGVYGDKKSDKKGYKAKINIGADGNYIELAENALYVNSSKESGKDNRFHKDAKEWDYYVKTVKSDGNYYDVLINVKDTGNEQFVYDITLKEAGNLPEQLSSYDGNQPASTDIVTEKSENVKYSLSNGTGEQSKVYGNRTTYGKDIALESEFAPVQETVQAEVQEAPKAEDNTTFRNVDDYAPLTKDEANIRDDAQIDEHYFMDDIAPLPQEYVAIEPEPIKEPNEPKTATAEKSIKTAKDRQNAQLAAVQEELNNDRQLKEESYADYTQQIEKLQAEYDAKKNKTTKTANNILRRIERLKRLRDSVDADYSKRISDLETKEKLVREGKPTTREALHEGYVNGIKAGFAERGMDFDEVLKKAKDLSTFATVDNTPQRVMEKALGYKQGQILSDLTVNQVAQNETEAIKWLNSFTDRKRGLLAQFSKQYNIKPGSKESAGAQMYAEGFYVDGNNNIIKYGDAELAKDFPNPRVQANIKGLANDERIRQIYDETLKMINESRTRNAYPEIPRLDNYFLHFRAMDDTFSRLGLPFNPNDIRAKDLPTDLNGVTADLKPGQPYFASAMHRTGKRTSYDLLGGLERYLTSAKNQIYHIDDIQTLRALRNYVAEQYGQAHGLDDIDNMSEEEAQEKIKEVFNSHLSTFAKFLNEEANVLAGKTTLIDRSVEGIFGRRAITFLDTLNRQVGSNMVGLNVSSSLTNILSAVQTFAKTNKADYSDPFCQDSFLLNLSLGDKHLFL